MITTELVSANVLLVANVLLLGAAAIELLRFKRVLRRHGNISVSDSSPVSAAEKAPDQLYRLIDERIAALQKIAEELSRKDEILQRANHPRESPYESAVRLARRGANAEQLVACGLNQGEAQLMVRMYAKP